MRSLLARIAFGGHRKQKIYGRLDCPSALRAIANGKGTYEQQRVFFRSEEEAIAQGFRPCAICLPTAYLVWKRKNNEIHNPR